MAAVESQMLPLGTQAPAFSLPDPDGKLHSLLEDSQATAWGYTFPYLHDESQSVAKAYRAACMPDFYLFDAEQKPGIGCSIKWRAGNEPEYF